MTTPALSPSAANLLIALVADERTGLQAGEISYGNDQADQEALSDLKELSEFAHSSLRAVSQ